MYWKKLYDIATCHDVPVSLLFVGRSNLGGRLSIDDSIDDSEVDDRMDFCLFTLARPLHQV